MTTKNHQDSANVYNDRAMGTYNMFQPQIANTLQQMVNNPLASSFFKNQLNQSMNVTNQIGQRNNTNVLRNLRTGGGVLSNSGFATAMLNRNNLTNSVMQGNAFNTSLNNALQTRNQGLTGMQAYQPLQTGQNQTSYQSGVGTWLAPVLGGALNLLAPGLGSMMGGQGFSAGYKPSGGGGSSSPFSAPSSGLQTPNFVMQNNYPGFQMPKF